MTRAVPIVNSFLFVDPRQIIHVNLYCTVLYLVDLNGQDAIVRISAILIFYLLEKGSFS